MQYDAKYPGVSAYKAVTISAEQADLVATGKTDRLILHKSSPYRGDVLLVTSPRPVGERSGMIVGRANIDDIVRVPGGYLWKFSNPSRIIEVPCQKCTMRGVVWDCFYTDGAIMEYPKISLRPYLSFFKK